MFVGLIRKYETRLERLAGTTVAGRAKDKNKEHKSCLGRVFNFLLGRFAS
jgi:hypothetical protein